MVPLVMPADEPGRGRRLDLTGLAIAVPAVSRWCPGTRWR
jgi:hypothetical protein